LFRFDASGECLNGVNGAGLQRKNNVAFSLCLCETQHIFQNITLDRVRINHMMNITSNTHSSAKTETSLVLFRAEFMLRHTLKHQL
jgi:hypothetical protein